MKRLHKLGYSFLPRFVNAHPACGYSYNAFRQFAFAIDFKPTTIFFGEETRIYFNEMAWFKPNIKTRL